MVHHGTNLVKGDCFVEFKEFFSMMKNRISDGADVPYFFRDLFAMITEVSEEEWGTPKDPSSTRTKDESLRSYSKRNIPKTFARNIVYRLTPENFIASINARPVATRELLANDYSPIDASATSLNIAQLLADCFVDIIKRAAGIVDKPALEKQKMQQAELDIRNRYGDYLLYEAGNSCPIPGCGRSLVISNLGRTSTSYNVALIDKKKAPEVNNLLALCPHCYAIYSIDDNKKISKELSAVKKLLINHRNNVQLLDGMPLESGIVGVISKVKKLKEKDLEDASLEPHKIIHKIEKSESIHLYITVNTYVTTYYLKIRQIMMNADKRGDIDYEEVQDQMKAIYKKLKKAKKSKEEIFNEITQKLHKISLQDEIYCQIVVSYFIQSCEVFDAITK